MDTCDLGVVNGLTKVTHSSYAYASMVDFRGNRNTTCEMSFSLRWGLSFEYGCASFEAWLWVVEGLTLERCSTFGKKDKLEPSYVGPFEILGWIGPIVRLKIYVLWAEYRKLDWEFLFDELRVKVRWDSKRGPELTWERKDQMRSRELKRNGNVMVVNYELNGAKASLSGPAVQQLWTLYPGKQTLEMRRLSIVSQELFIIEGMTEMAVRAWHANNDDSTYSVLDAMW
ncbi:hypothetical protein Tco_0754212 [Tanacetum coccineum]